MMQIDPYVLLGVFIVGLALGGVAVWLVSGSRQRSETKAAVAQAQSAVNVQLASATARAVQAENARQQMLTERNEARQRVDQLQESLSAAGNQNAQLAERAGRVPGLEEQLTQARADLDAVNRSLADLRESSGSTIAQLTADLQSARDHLAAATSALQAANEAHAAAQRENAQLRSDRATLQERYDAEQRSAEEKLRLLNQASEALTNQFKTLANDILEEKARRFTDQNQTNLNQLLDPLRTKITDFQAQVQRAYEQEGNARSALVEQVSQLRELNQTLSEDARNLASALKGSSKTQGDWGEMILEQILEVSGLIKGETYVTQDAQFNPEGKRLQPDVVINLPEQKRLVVDAKVSLTAYERFASAEDGAEREAALQQHLASVRGHIRTLSGKNYQALYGLKSLDFVLMFVPVEPAFMLAVTNCRGLFSEAWASNVLLVSPSTLLFVLRTVAHLWRQEAQRQNAAEIARRGALLYDRLVDFVEDLRNVGARLHQAQEAYADAERRLTIQKGNVIWQAKMLGDLGVKPNKQLPESYVELAEANEDVAHLFEINGVNGERALAPES
jgi:DNA recombination protein RmuC